MDDLSTKTILWVIKLLNSTAFTSSRIEGNMEKKPTLWEKAYESYKREKTYIKDPSTYRSKPSYKKTSNHPFTKELSKELTEINIEIRRLKKRRSEIKKQLVRPLSSDLKFRPTPWVLYALKLEDNCWYIGMTHNIAKRFNQHLEGKGAVWTARHKPIEIIETRPTNFLLEEPASRLEDAMTIEYALKYGSKFVRGGGYCQTKPKWTNEIIEKENLIV